MKITVRTKIIAGFVAVSILTLLLGAFMLHRMSSVNSEVSNLANNRMPAMKNIGSDGIQHPCRKSLKKV